MLYVNAYQSPYTIVRCFNSTLAGAAATTPPCGITFNEVQVGMWAFTFNFEVDDRFWSGTLAEYSNTEVINVSVSDPYTLMVNTGFENATFSVIVF
jgi:hypothetical protein